MPSRATIRPLSRTVTRKKMTSRSDGAEFHQLDRPEPSSIRPRSAPAWMPRPIRGAPGMRASTWIGQGVSSPGCAAEDSRREDLPAEPDRRGNRQRRPQHRVEQVRPAQADKTALDHRLHQRDHAKRGQRVLRDADSKNTDSRAVADASSCATGRRISRVGPGTHRAASTRTPISSVQATACGMFSPNSAR